MAKQPLATPPQTPIGKQFTDMARQLRAALSKPGYQFKNPIELMRKFMCIMCAMYCCTFTDETSQTELMTLVYEAVKPVWHNSTLEDLHKLAERAVGACHVRVRKAIQTSTSCAKCKNRKNRKNRKNCANCEDRKTSAPFLIQLKNLAQASFYKKSFYKKSFDVIDIKLSELYALLIIRNTLFILRHGHQPGFISK